MGDGPDQIRAAGAVLWRPGRNGPEVALVHRPKYDDWSFPKGKAKDGEHMLRTAVREVWEESGVWPVLGRRLPAREYVKESRSKRVDYWAATGNGGDFRPNEEIDRVEWLPVPEAERRLSYEHDADLLREFAAGPNRTTPYIVLRHTSAGDKREWDGDDVLRPLDERGRAEAAALAETLAGYGQTRVFSSATARCMETVLPYAARMSADIRTDWAFSVGTPMAASKEAGGRFAQIIGEGAAALVCTHGELVPELIERACETLGAPVPEDPRLPKGGFWVLHVARDALVSAERHRLQAM
ncbi:NUDIX hydrolase [Actinoallomurus iriomotensis]|uniref:8-oxo-dGTP diphosphatase n=1 Tax=Actinoallomurus iriomotensis TaxID=478107 RepID=A0A9W6S8S0_9ACTN|nr:NUDIX hydrolase [Actinoallomurus iriomotensis]GLY89221.1 8-oxo-dGTP diphosphatase [Actinoallomurus iriomotensis]